ncbi:MAG: NDP-sugar synthase [Candidatus Obscuribacterales bacterium]|nr:NDP-sugar synthase [Candidatus Obscuribacterales bacterium]
MEKNGVKAVVLAAGAGSRLAPLTGKIPKPLAPIANLPTMEHVLRLLKKHNISEVSANLHHFPESIPNYFDKVRDLDMPINYVVEESLSGDAGGVRACKCFLSQDTFVVVMGDVITDIDISYLVAEHKRKGAIASIGLKQVEDVTQFGVVALDDNGFITAFQEKPKAAEAISNLASTGIYVLEPEVFNYFPETGEFSFGKQLFKKLLEIGAPLLGVEVDGYWSDIGTIPSYLKTSFDAIQGKVDLKLPQAVLTKESAAEMGIECDGKLLLGSGVVLGQGIKIKGNAIIGNNCMIGSGVTLDNSIIWNGSTIAKDSMMVRSIVAENCHLRSYSRYFDSTIVELAQSNSNAVPRILGRAKSKTSLAS